MNFIKNTIIFSVATLISRILGYIRDATVAYYFGANVLTDAFYVAWRLPNTLRQLIGEGSFNAAFIPIYSQQERQSIENAKLYASSLFSYYTLILSLITGLVILFAPYFVKIIAPGISKGEGFEVATELVRIVFPYLILIGWTSFFMALLNTRDKFFIPAVSPALLNLSFIFSSVFFVDRFGIYALAYGALIGGLLQFLVQMPQAFKEGLIFKPTLKPHPQIKTTLKRMVPAFAAFGVSQFSFVIDTIIASFLATGAITYLYYGNRIFQLPLGVFIIGLGNALLVSLSKHYSDGNLREFYTSIQTGIKFSIFISLPATAGMVFLGREIVDVLLVRGNFSPYDALITYYALVGYSVGFLGYALTRPFKSGYFAKGDTKTPLISTAFGVFGSIIFALLFTFAFNWGVFGLAFASSLGGFLNVAYLYFRSHFDIDIKDISISFLKNFIAVGFMVLSIEFIKFAIASKIVVVFLSIFISSAVYFVVNTLLKDENSIMFLNILKRKVKVRQ
ncbi:MAG: murein biosynthesis integral membrane protein MurJ [Hydrogenothermaceae bacterium]|nr:murein biosynthesis integral membrane protein MurJ [Hydrogenothermaceae bacterium]